MNYTTIYQLKDVTNFSNSDFIPIYDIENGTTNRILVSDFIKIIQAVESINSKTGTTIILNPDDLDDSQSLKKFVSDAEKSKIQILKNDQGSSYILCGDGQYRDVSSLGGGGSIVCNTITERNSLTNLKDGQMVLVRDASGDATVNSGSALYDYNAGTGLFNKVSEYESMDLILSFDKIEGEVSGNTQLVSYIQTKSQESDFIPVSPSWWELASGVTKTTLKAGLDYIQANFVQKIKDVFISGLETTKHHIIASTWFWSESKVNFYDSVGTGKYDGHYFSMHPNGKFWISRDNVSSDPTANYTGGYVRFNGDAEGGDKFTRYFENENSFSQFEEVISKAGWFITDFRATKKGIEYNFTDNTGLVATSLVPKAWVENYIESGSTSKGDNKLEAEEVTTDSATHPSPSLVFRAKYDSDSTLQADGVTPNILSTKKDFSLRNTVASDGTYHLDILNDAGTDVVSILSDGKLQWSGDTNLYRSVAGQLKTDNGFHIGSFLRLDGQLLVGHSTDIQVRDSAGGIHTRGISGLNYVRAGGSAFNYFKGNVYVGSTTDTGVSLHVTGVGSDSTTSSFKIQNAVGTSALEVKNDATIHAADLNSTVLKEAGTRVVVQTDARLTDERTPIDASVTIPKINAADLVGMYDVPATEKSKLETAANWDAGGNYIGTVFTNTYQGQEHYHANYFYKAIADNSWIRMIRG